MAVEVDILVVSPPYPTEAELAPDRHAKRCPSDEMMVDAVAVVLNEEGQHLISWVVS